MNLYADDLIHMVAHSTWKTKFSKYVSKEDDEAYTIIRIIYVCFVGIY